MRCGVGMGVGAAREQAEAGENPAEIRAAAREEHGPLLAWLDRGLRGGRLGRLEAEYGPLLAPDAPDAFSVIGVRHGRFVSHAFGRVVRVHAAGRSTRIGMIGLVFTEPDARGRGLAGACVDACAERLRERGATLAALWSDKRAFYGRLGFTAAGREWLYRVDAESCAAARRSTGAPAPEVSPPRAPDWTALEALYTARTGRAEREPGALARLASAPDCRVRVARAEGRPLAYAACGRGDDFRGVVHEWAGEPGGVLACLETLARESGPVHWLTGPVDEEPGPSLRAAGAHADPGALALVRPLDAQALWAELAASRPELAGLGLAPQGDRFAFVANGTTTTLDATDAVGLLLGPRLPGAALRALAPEQRRALRRVLPWPLFVWGFDSI